MLMLALPAVAQVGDLELGERLAPGMAPPTGDAAPPSAPRATAARLRALLALPHRDMPDQRLSRAEAEAVIAWLLAQRP